MERSTGSPLRMPRRVAMVAMHSSPVQAAGTGDSGGMNVLLLALARELADRGVAVDLLTRAAGRPAVTQLWPGIVLRELAAGPAALLPKRELLPVVDEFGEAVGRLARRHPYDLIHAHYWLSGLAALPVALELGLPLVQSFHTLAAMKDAERPVWQEVEPARRLMAERYLAAQADAVIAGSAAEAACLVERMHAPARHTWVIPPGVDVDLFRPDRPGAPARVRAALGVGPDRPILAVVGRVQPLKNQELAIRMLAEIRAPAAPVLVVAGEATPGDGGYADGLRHTAAALGADTRFVGALGRDGLADLLTAAAVTLVPSRSETFGMIALESAASGTPVVAFRGTGLVESVADGASGLLVDSWEPREWATATATLIGAGSRFAASARHHALGFGWPAAAASLLAVYGSLLA
jgi:D-inositol-3-phosphate glycosyltransferase